MADISSITLPNGSTYNFKDAEARNSISALGTSNVYYGETTNCEVVGRTSTTSSETTFTFTYTGTVTGLTALSEGIIVVLLMYSSISHASNFAIYLNLNSLGSKPVYVRSGVYGTTTEASWTEGSYSAFFYDGDAFYLIDFKEHYFLSYKSQSLTSSQQNQVLVNLGFTNLGTV